MPRFDFPIFKTKIPGVEERFRLEDPLERRKYFEAKAGVEIEKLRDYLRENTFVAFLLGKKNSGKGTYAKLFMEAVGGDRVAHVSIGDIVRAAHRELEDSGRRRELVAFLERRYRGFITIPQALDIIAGRDTKTLLPTEVILALVEREIDRLGRKAVFLDGFPRNLDQVSYSLYFRALIGYRDDPDFLVFIDVPEAVIDERMKHRVVCPRCNTPRNTKLLRTRDVAYDEAEKTFYLLCDNPECPGFGKTRMAPKEGDELGVEAIQERVEADAQVMATLRGLQGLPKVFLRNSVPVAVADQYIDRYEITPAYRYEWRADGGKVEVIEEPWVVSDNNGEPSYSLLPAAVAVALIRQTADVLGL